MPSTATEPLETDAEDVQRQVDQPADEEGVGRDEAEDGQRPPDPLLLDDDQEVGDAGDEQRDDDERDDGLVDAEQGRVRGRQREEAGGAVVAAQNGMWT